MPMFPKVKFMVHWAFGGAPAISRSIRSSKASKSRPSGSFTTLSEVKLHADREIISWLSDIHFWRSFVIAETGMGGEAETNERALGLMKAQADVAQLPEFKNNVAFVGTRAFWRPTELSPSDQGYHWNSNAETYYLIGDAMGRAMTDLLKRVSR